MPFKCVENASKFVEKGFAEKGVAKQKKEVETRGQVSKFALNRACTFVNHALFYNDECDNED